MVRELEVITTPQPYNRNLALVYAHARISHLDKLHPTDGARILALNLVIHPLNWVFHPSLDVHPELLIWLFTPSDSRLKGLL